MSNQGTLLLGWVQDVVLTVVLTLPDNVSRRVSLCVWPD